MMNTTIFKYLLPLSAASAAVGLMGGYVSYAQAEDFRGIEEVIVTARKRSESLQDIPIAITAMNASKISELGATQMDDLVANVPNLAFDPNGNSLSSWGLRGIVSQTRNAGQESGLGIYVDQVYIGRPAAFNFPLVDIEQVEVLRGPQGSLFGRNTIAGAINISTSKPGNELDGSIKVAIGNYQRKELQLGVSGPIIEDTLAAKISAFSFQRDGYADNLFDGGDYMDDDRQGFRGALYWTPGDQLEVILSMDYTKQDNKQLFGQTLEPQLNNFIPDWYQADTYKVNQNDPNTEEIKSGGLSLTLNWELESGFTLTSISSSRYTDFEIFADDDAGPVTITYSHFEDDSDIFTQELRLTSPQSERFDYLFGIYYMDQEVSAQRATPLVPFPDASVGIFSRSNVESKAWAIFGTSNMYLNDAWTLSIGLRYTDEDKDSQFTQSENAGLGFPNVSFSPTQQDEAVSGDLSVTYKASENISLYGSVRKGFKSGGFQTDIIDFATEELFVFGPEEAISYEIGMKGIFLEQRLKLNAAVFRTDYSDMQVGQLLGLGFTTTNAGESEITGLELESEFFVSEYLSLSLNLGLMDHEYTKFDNCGLSSCAGNDLQLVSDWSASGTVAYIFPLNSGAIIKAHLDWSVRDEYFTDAVNDPDLVVENRTLVNGRIGYVSQNENWSVFLWAKNLLDKEYDSLRWKYPVTPLAFGEFDPSITGLERLVSEPRMYGLEVTYDF